MSWMAQSDSFDVSKYILWGSVSSNDSEQSETDSHVSDSDTCESEKIRKMMSFY